MTGAACADFLLTYIMQCTRITIYEYSIQFRIKCFHDIGSKCLYYPPTCSLETSCLLTSGIEGTEGVEKIDGSMSCIL